MSSVSSSRTFVDWAAYAQPGVKLSGESLIEEAQQEMLRRGVDFAVVLDERNRVLALASFKRIAAVLSAKYGQALFSRRQLKATRVHSKIVGAARPQADDYLAVVTPIEHMVVIHPQEDFFEAQRKYEQRPVENHFDDMVLVDAKGCYVGMLPVREFNRLQHQMLLRQEAELVERNRQLEQTLAELSRTQGELISAAKLAALGELVAGITHEMNTPLGILLSSQEMVGRLLEKLQDDLTRSELGRKWSGTIQTNLKLGADAGVRISRIIESLRLFGQRGEERMQEADLIELIESALVLLANQFNNGITVDATYPDVEAAMMTCHPGELSQVFAHILTNAIQVMQGKGCISISVRKEADEWLIEFRDTGPGIAPEILDRIFDPGFTTKGVGVGTGLGLSISKKIIEINHGGKIRAENHPESGAVICLSLPLNRTAK